MSRFHRCIDFVLCEEGGLSNHPKDPGGLTQFGISQRSYPKLDIRRLTVDAAKAIYQRDFWARIQGYPVSTILAGQRQLSWPVSCRFSLGTVSPVL